jgi:hypothetical protein
MKEDFHVRFWNRGMNGNIHSTVTLSHPGAVSGSKGLVVRQVIAVHYLSLEHCEIVWPLSTVSVKS